MWSNCSGVPRGPVRGLATILICGLKPAVERFGGLEGGLRSGEFVLAARGRGFASPRSDRFSNLGQRCARAPVWTVDIAAGFKSWIVRRNRGGLVIPPLPGQSLVKSVRLGRSGMLLVPRGPR